MDINVLSREMAKERIPRKPELMIGVLDSHSYFESNTPINPIPSDLRLDYLTYTFDDVPNPNSSPLWINNEISDNIISDFIKYKDKIESLAVHCRAGISRSAAVAAALNDFFNLERFQDDFFRGIYDPKLEVYYSIIGAAKRKGIKVENIY